MKKNESPESRYRKIGPIYIRKGVLLLLIAAAAIAVLAKFGFPTGLIRYHDGGPPVYRFDDPQLQECSEEVRIRDRRGVIRYEGPVEKGVCTGMAQVYDEQGKLCYQGPMVENRWEGENARVYRDGKLLYLGGMKNNRYEGLGRLFDPETGTSREGIFRDGLEEGRFLIYDPMGTLVKDAYYEHGVDVGWFPDGSDGYEDDPVPSEPVPEQTEPVSLFKRIRSGIFNFLWDLME